MVDGEGPLEGRDIPHQQATGVVRLKEPLVRVDADGIGPLDTPEQTCPGLGNGREAPVRGVGVQPDAVRFAVVRDGVQGIDRAGAGGAGVGADGDGRAPGVPVGLDGGCQGVDRQSKVRSRRQHPNPIRANTDDPRGTNLGAVALVAHVDGCPRRIPRRLARGHEGIEGRRGPAAGQHAAGGLRVSQPASEPVDHDAFELTWPTRGQPGGGIDIEAGHEVVREHTRPCRRRRHEPEGPRVVVSHRRREDLLHGAVDDLARCPAALRRILHQPGGQLLLELAVPCRNAGQTLGTLDQNLGDVARKLPHQLGRHLQAVRHGLRSARAPRPSPGARRSASTAGSAAVIEPPRRTPYDVSHRCCIIRECPKARLFQSITTTLTRLPPSAPAQTAGSALGSGGSESPP